MPIDIIVGGQAGDEGKGKIAAYLAKSNKYSAVIRTSSPQAGHTLEYKGKRIGLATIPCGFVYSRAKVIIGRGAFISIKRLEQELENTGLENSRRLSIDHYATIITQEHLDEELQNRHLMKKIGSVGTGSGPARKDKIMRNPNLIFAKDIPELEPYLKDTVVEINHLLSLGKKISLEGDQGFKLSLIHGEYPFVTSRDVTASSFLGEIGVGPKEVQDVYLVFKPYVTRVDGRPIKGEITDKEKLEWCKNKGHEVGTVSGRVRKIGEFDWENAKRAIKVNGATKLCFTHMDYFMEKGSKELGDEASEFIEQVRKKLCLTYPSPEISLLSYGPKIGDVLKY